MLIATLLAVDDRSTHLKSKASEEINFEDKDVDKGEFRKLLKVVSLILILITVAIYLLLSSIEQSLYSKIIQLMFAGYGLSILLFPTIYFSSRIIRPTLSIFGIYLGVTILIVGSIIGIVTGNLIITQTTPILAFIITLLFVKFSSQKDNQ